MTVALLLISLVVLAIAIRLQILTVRQIDALHKLLEEMQAPPAPPPSVHPDLRTLDDL